MPRRMTPLHKSLELEFLAIAKTLEAEHSICRLRFDRGESDIDTAYALGRIGRRFFEFKLEDGIAGLIVGSPAHRRRAGMTKRARKRGLRSVRRGNDPLDMAWALRRVPYKGADRHPERVVWMSYRRYIHSTETPLSEHPTEIIELINQLLGSLRHAGPRGSTSRLSAYLRGSSTPPMSHTPGIIRKPSKRRR